MTLISSSSWDSPNVSNVYKGTKARIEGALIGHSMSRSMSVVVDNAW